MLHCHSQSNIKYMLRLLLKVHSVSIRVKEEAQVQICVRKGQHGYLIPFKSRLIDGIAVFDVHTEFFVTRDDPTFELNVMMVLGSMRKFAGMCTINLEDWQMGTNNSTMSLLQKSPDQRSCISFQFIFMTTDLPPHKKSLVGTHQIENDKKSIIMKEYSEINVKLAEENIRLETELTEMRRFNEELNENKTTMEEKRVERELNHEEQIRKMTEDKANSELEMARIREKMEKLMLAIQNSEETPLQQKLKDMMSEEEEEEQEEECE